MRVLVCGGGTGGHIYPALAAVTELRQHGLVSEQFLWVGTQGQMEEDLVPRTGLKLETIRGGPIVGVSPGTMLRNSGQLLWSLGKTMRLFSQFRPDVVFMTGGYVNVPVALVARLRGLPIAIFLPDVEPGRAIKTLSRLARRVAATTEASRAYFPPEKVRITGYPVRPALREAAAMSQEEALAQFELSTEYQTLLVFGGSRGARSINRALMASLLPLLEQEIQVIHISGTLDWSEVEANMERLPAESLRFYRAYPYLHERMGAAFRAADLVLARAGASMLGETPAFGLPSILVPYPHAWRYQKVNADYLAERGAAVRLDDELLAEGLLPTVLQLLQNEGQLATMAHAAAALDVPDSARRLAELILDLGQENNG